MTQHSGSIVYIGLGSNLRNPQQQLLDAIDKLRHMSDIAFIAVSSFYQSTALTLAGSGSQADYINAAAKISTTLSPLHLLHKLQEIEDAQGRQRTAKWAARTLDLDILLYDDLQLQSAELTIPHAQMKHRNFVVLPLLEVAGELHIPGLGLLSELSAGLSRLGLEKLHSSNA